LLKNIYKMQYLKGSGTPVLYIGRPVPIDGPCSFQAGSFKSCLIALEDEPGDGLGFEFR